MNVSFTKACAVGNSIGTQSGIGRYISFAVTLSIEEAELLLESLLEDGKIEILNMPDENIKGEGDATKQNMKREE